MKLINFIPLLYVPVCILFAYCDSVRIKKGKHISHGYNAFVHIVTAVIFAYWSKWENFFSTLALAKVAFDTALNVFRDGWRNVWYVSPEVSRYNSIKDAFKHGKVLDYLEYRAFGFNAIPPKIIYSVIAIIMICV